MGSYHCMLTFTTYSEAGGVGKSTIAASTAAAAARRGRDVLTVDLDPQNGSLTHLLGVQFDRTHDGDTLVHHLIGREKGSFEDLIRGGPHGIDVVPSHNMLTRLEELLRKSEEIAEQTGEEFNPVDQLRMVLGRAGVHDQYDTLIVDPPATPGPHLYNAISATRSLLVPIELSGKGKQSIEGLEKLVAGLEDEIGAEVGVLAVVPNRVENTNDQERYRNMIESMGYDVPVTIRKRSSLFQGCWDQQCDPWTFIEEHRSRTRDYELETLEKLETLFDHLVQVTDATAQNRAEA